MGRNEIFAIVLLFFIGARCQENAIKNISPSLIECYDNELYAKHNLLPHSMDTFIAIVRKIEQSPMSSMDLRVLSTAILHRFRQDGIEMNPEVRPQAGIMPYAPLGKQFYRHAQTLRIVPGNAVNFPNNSISPLERCTLHSMLSSSIDRYKHNGENRACKTGNYGMNNYGFLRWPRHAHGPKDDVETLSPEQLEMLMTKDQVEPNSRYPAFPPNHPSASARITEDQLSECPIENGVVQTAWGPVSGGSVLAGIAAGLVPQTIRIGELIKQQVEPRIYSGLPTDANLDNKFLATLAGDLAEVALDQGPQSRGRFSVGADGNWNSTSQPLYYFLSSKEDLQMTAAEIRGDLDGLILANEVAIYNRKYSGLRLSQILDMYYSDRGLFDSRNRACNRRAQLLKVAPTETLVSQTRSAAIVLSSVGYATVTILPDKIDAFSAQAVKELSDFIPSMNKDNACEFSDSLATKSSRPAIDLTVILDTNWPFQHLQPILAQLLSGVEINKFNSNFTIMNGQNGHLIVNSSNSILDFANFNCTNYSQLQKGFDLALSVKKLEQLDKYKLDEEKRRGLAGGRSNVVVIMPYHVNLPPTDREFIWNSLEDMRKEVPDTRVLFLTYGQKDVWAELVEDSDDVISISFSENMENNPAVDSILTRMKQVPRRLVNTQCGSNYEQTGSSRQLINFVGPDGINFYRIHPNYFMSDSNDKPKLKVQGSGGKSLRVCWSRDLLHVNASSAQLAATCATTTGNTLSIEMNCEGVSYIHQCKPYYLSVESTSNNTDNMDCPNPNECRYPNDIRYTISFDNLVCKSRASTLLVTPLLFLATLARFFI